MRFSSFLFALRPKFSRPSFWSHNRLRPKAPPSGSPRRRHLRPQEPRSTCSTKGIILLQQRPFIHIASACGCTLHRTVPASFFSLWTDTRNKTLLREEKKMYIPIGIPLRPRGIAPPVSEPSMIHSRHSVSLVHRILSRLAASMPTIGEASFRLDHRRLRRTPLQTQDQTVSIVVGVLVGLFVLVLLIFLWRYRFSVRVTHKSSKHGSSYRGSSVSKSSQSSRSSAGGSASEG
jgi:hypothetical protein